MGMFDLFKTTDSEPAPNKIPEYSTAAEFRQRTDMPSRYELERMFSADFVQLICRAIKWERGTPPDLNDPDFWAMRIDTPQQKKKMGYTSAEDAARLGDPGGATKGGFAQRARGVYLSFTLSSTVKLNLRMKGYREMLGSEYVRLTGLNLPYGMKPSDAVFACIIEELTFWNVLHGYKEDYCDPVRFDEIGGQVAIHIADHGFGRGPRMAIKMVQRAVGATPDGVFGPATMASVQAIPADKLLPIIIQARLNDFESCNQPQFMAGWRNRVLDKQIY